MYKPESIVLGHDTIFGATSSNNLEFADLLALEAGWVSNSGWSCICSEGGMYTCSRKYGARSAKKVPKRPTKVNPEVRKNLIQGLKRSIGSAGKRWSILCY